MFRRVTRPFAAMLIGSLIGTAGCGSTAETSVNPTGPAARCQATLAPAPSSFGPSGGSGSVAINVARECSWSAAATATWIVLTSAREGQGEGTLAYRVAENGDPVARRGAITIAEQSVEVSQEPAPCRFTVTAGDTTTAASGGELGVDVRTHSACRWTAASSADWATPTPASGSGDAGIRVLVSVNTGSRRSADLTVAGQRVTVTQDANLPGPPPPPPPAPTPPPSPPAPAPPSPASPSAYSGTRTSTTADAAARAVHPAADLAQRKLRGDRWDRGRASAHRS